MEKPVKVFASSDSFEEKVDGVSVTKSWNDIECISPEEKQRIMSSGDRLEQEKLFHNLFLLQNSNKYINSNDEKARQSLLEKAYKKAKDKYNREKRNEIAMIVMLDDLFCFGESDRPYINNLYKDMLTQLTKNSILVTDEKTYKQQWFKELNLKDTVSEIRIMQKVHRRFSDSPPDMRPMSRKSSEDYRRVTIIGGETPYKEYYPFVTDLYIVFLPGSKKARLDQSRFFTKINLANFNLIECYNQEYEGTLYKAVHLRAISGRKNEWHISELDRRYTPQKKKSRKEERTEPDGNSK